jgi:hypothetical protein
MFRIIPSDAMSINPALSSDLPAEYLTRRQAAEFIRDTLGRPFSFSTATKLAALREFAEPTIWWGRRPLYTRETLRAWVEARDRRTRAPTAFEMDQPAPSASTKRQRARTARGR